MEGDVESLGADDKEGSEDLEGDVDVDSFGADDKEGPEEGAGVGALVWS